MQLDFSSALQPYTDFTSSSAYAPAPTAPAPNQSGDWLKTTLTSIGSVSSLFGAFAKKETGVSSPQAYSSPAVPVGYQLVPDRPGLSLPVLGDINVEGGTIALFGLGAVAVLVLLLRR